MKIISVCNMKGGVCKSTTSINLSAELASAHELQVLLVDADSNRHVLKWAKRGELNDKYERDFDVVGLSQLGKALQRKKYDCLVTDTAAQLTQEELIDAAEGSDFIVVPMMPSIDGYGPTLDTIAVIQEAIDYRILLSNCPTRSSDAEEFRADMIDDGYKFFETRIRQSVGIPRASLAGIPVREFKQYPAVAEDYASFSTELASIIGVMS